MLKVDQVLCWVVVWWCWYVGILFTTPSDDLVTYCAPWSSNNVLSRPIYKHTTHLYYNIETAIGLGTVLAAYIGGLTNCHNLQISVNVDFFGPKQSSLCTGFCCNPHASIRFNPLWVQTLNASHAIHQKPRGETEGSVVHHHAHRKGAGIHKVLRRNRYLGGVAMGSSMWTSKLAPECHHPLLGPLGVSHQIKKNARMSHGFHLSTGFEVVKSLTSHQGLHDKISWNPIWMDGCGCADSGGAAVKDRSAAVSYFGTNGFPRADVDRGDRPQNGLHVMFPGAQHVQQKHTQQNYTKKG